LCTHMAKAKASSEPDQTVVPFVRERPSRRLWLGAPDEIVNVKPRHPLVAEIEAFLEEVDMSPTFFGYGVMRDPTFVFEARGGRDLRGTTEHKVRVQMAFYRQCRQFLDPGAVTTTALALTRR